MLKRLATLASTTALLVALPVGAAQAEPRGESFTLEGDNGVTYTLTTPPAAADWTPGLLTGSTSVIRPTFKEFTITKKTDTALKARLCQTFPRACGLIAPSSARQ